MNPVPRAVNFGRLADDYDRVRPVDDNWREVYDIVVREGDFRGRRVLDCGCGTGRLSKALAESEASKVWGVDPEPEMLRVAEQNVPPSVGLKAGRAEQLPFRDAWFERAVMWLVCHLVDRPAAFAELRRVLTQDGRLVVVTFDPVHFGEFWLNRYFPSIERIDRARFPDGGQLEVQLASAGFGGVRLVRHSQRASISREEALERIEQRHISTFDLLDPDEVTRGTARAVGELPPTIEYGIEWLIAVAAPLIAVLGCAALAAVAWTAGGSAAAQVDVAANVTWVKHGIEYRRVQVRITRDGRRWTSGRLGTAYFIRPVVHVRDLDADGEPEVWVDTYTGGAHCCLDSRFFRWLPSLGTYTSTEHGWRDIGYQRRRLDGDSRPELVSADARFGYMFTAFAGSAFPVQIWHFDRGRLIDVTRDYPAEIERDADQLWRSYRRFRSGRDDPRGVLAAWVADQYLLGRGNEGWATLTSLARKRQFGPRPDLRRLAAGRRVLARVAQLLEEDGLRRVECPRT